MSESKVADLASLGLTEDVTCALKTPVQVGFYGYTIIAVCMLLSGFTLMCMKYSMAKSLRKCFQRVTNCANCFQCVMLIWLPIAALSIGTKYCAGMYQYDPNTGSEIQLTVLETQQAYVWTVWLVLLVLSFTYGCCVMCTCCCCCVPAMKAAAMDLKSESSKMNVTEDQHKNLEAIQQMFEGMRMKKNQNAPTQIQ